jgi:hypothetical protein
MNWFDWFLDAFRQALRRDPEALAGRVLTADGVLGLLLAVIAVAMLVDSDLAGATGRPAHGPDRRDADQVTGRARQQLAPPPGAEGS